jgi:predicted enzyme related to lactoylglutathione lyase
MSTHSIPTPMDQTNKIYYIEFQASDLVKTKAFFEAVFGWTFTDYGPDYTSFADGRIAGGFARSDKRSSLSAGGALVVLLNQQLEETLRRVVDNGGTITQDIFSYPGGRRFHFTEPSGNELSVCAEA